MIICNNCNHKNHEGSFFCENCGVAIESLPIGTSALGNGDSEELKAGSDTLSDDSIIFLHIQDIADPITIQIHEQIVLGRAGGGNGNVAHLNLDNFGASEAGVSRRHALLHRKVNHLYIEDLGSTNYTYINDQRLPVGRQFRLSDGDMVRLGHMNLRVFFK